MQVENQNLIFSVFNKKLVYTLAVLTLLSLVMVALFFTVIREEYIVLGLPFVFFVFVLPIFMIGMRNKIIYRFTIDELQYRGQNPCIIKWNDLKKCVVENDNIIITLNNNTNIYLPVLNFNKDELKKAFSLYVK